LSGVPAKVTSLHVENSTVQLAGGNSSFRLSWEKPWQFDNNFPVTNYTISCSDNTVCPANQTVNTTSVNITNIISGVNYTFSVLATNAIGSGSPARISIIGPSGRYLCKIIVSN